MREKKEKGQVLPGSRQQLCTFYLGGRLFGVNILDVKEITPETTFTRIFHAVPEVKGYVNIRGQVHLVLDLSLLLGLDGRPVDSRSRVILFKPEVGDDFGVLVDQIGDVVSVDEQMIEERRHDDQEIGEQLERRYADLGKGVCKLEEELLVILHSRSFLESVRVS